MPGTVSVTEALGTPTANASADYAMIFVGASSLNPVATGSITPAFGSPSSASLNLGHGDMADGICNALAPSNDNPQPPPASAYVTPNTTPGSYGTINVAGVTGTAIPTNNAAVVPTGTTQPWLKVTTGGIVGTTGMLALASLDGGRTSRPVALGTANAYNFPASDGFAGEAGFTLAGTFTLTGTTDITSATITYGMSGQGLDGLTLILTVNGTNHTLTFAYGTTCATEAAALAAIHSTWGTLTATAGGLTGKQLVLTDSSGTGTILVGAGTANTLLGLAAATYAATLLAGDVMQTNTVAPQWADADLYTAGSPATGAFGAIGRSNQQFAIVVITEPIAYGDVPTLTAGLNYCASRGKRLSLITRFRDPQATGETDAQYVAAFQTFAAAIATLDSRITVCAGSCILTDAMTQRQYLRSFLPALCARLQGSAVIPGQRGERIAQNPGWVQRGPLPGVALHDASGNLIAGCHDELQLGGIEAAPGAATGAGVCLYYNPNPDVAGVYITNRCTCLYPVLSTILTPMDRRVANAVEQLIAGILWTGIGGADAWDKTTFALDPDLQTALSQKCAKAIKNNYGSEFQNAGDPNLVQVGNTVTVSGYLVTIPVAINSRLFGYGDQFPLTLAASR